MNDEYETKRERFQTVVTGVRTGVNDKLASIWWSFLLRGIFAIALGIFVIFWPVFSVQEALLRRGVLCPGNGNSWSLVALGASLTSWYHAARIPQPGWPGVHVIRVQMQMALT